MIPIDRRKIIIVEDDQDISRLLKLELEESGFHVDTFETGIRGLLAIREEQPDLVILDLGLPDLSGAEIARRVRSTSEIPIIILTAAHDLGTKVEMLNHGADDYLAKPFHISELVARVNVQLRKRTNTSVKKLGDLVLKTAEEVGRYPAAIEIVTIIPEELNKIATLAAQGVP